MLGLLLLQGHTKGMQLYKGLSEPRIESPEAEHCLKTCITCCLLLLLHSQSIKPLSWWNLILWYCGKSNRECVMFQTVGQ